MSEKANFVLTPATAAVIGINDELYALYLLIQEIYDGIYDDIRKRRPRNTDLMFEMVAEGKGRVKKAIDQTLRRMTFAFTNEYERLHPCNSTFNGFYFFDVKHTGVGKLQVCIISYAVFLNEIQALIVRIILNKKQYALPNIAYEDVENEVAEHIKKMAANKQAERLVCDEGMATRGFKDTIIIFENLSATSCNLNNHSVEPVTVLVPLLDSGNLVMLPVHHCTTCDRYFIGSETLKIYEGLYGKLFIRTIKEADHASDMSFFGESELHRTGYNVRKDGMTRTDRQAYLSKLIDDKVMSAFDVCRDIEKAIQIFEGRTDFTDAVAKWKEDLFYVSSKHGGEFIK